MEVKREKFLSHRFEPGGKVEFHRKDLGIALAVGREYGVRVAGHGGGVSDVRGPDGEGAGEAGITRRCSPSSRTCLARELKGEPSGYRYPKCARSG